MPPTPSVSAIVWRSPNRFGTSKSIRVAACPPTWIMLITWSQPSIAARRSRCASIVAAAPTAPHVQRAIASAASSRSGSMSWSAIVASASSGNVRRSPSRSLVNSTLPAPMNAIRVMRESVSDLIQTSKNVHGRGEARARPALHAGGPPRGPRRRPAHQAGGRAEGRRPRVRRRGAPRIQARSRARSRARRPGHAARPRDRPAPRARPGRIPGAHRPPGVARAKRCGAVARRAARGRAPPGSRSLGRPPPRRHRGQAPRPPARRPRGSGRRERRRDPDGRGRLCRLLPAARRGGAGLRG